MRSCITFSTCNQTRKLNVGFNGLFHYSLLPTVSACFCMVNCEQLEPVFVLPGLAQLSDAGKAVYNPQCNLDCKIMIVSVVLS